jgi:hypothetical protein
VRVLSVDESSGWLRQRQLSLRPALVAGADHTLETPGKFAVLRFTTPSDARRQVALAHLLAARLTCDRSLLLINVVALFKPHELDALLFLRRHYGDKRWVEGAPGGATPGHAFSDSPTENQRNVRELMIVMLAFTFEGYFVQEDGEVVVWLADEAVEIRSLSPERLAGPRGIVSLLVRALA